MDTAIKSGYSPCMLQAIRSGLRWLFATEAVIFFTQGLMGMLRRYGALPALMWAFYIGTLAASIFLAYAWWATRSPRKPRSIFGITASLVNVAFLAPSIYLDRHFESPATSLSYFLFAGSIAGIYAFSKCDPRSHIGPMKLPRMPGDCTNPWSDKIVVGLFAVFVWVSLGACYRFASAHELPRYSFLAEILLLSLASLVSATVHECGHAVIASIYGMRLLAFNAGPFQWRRRDGRWSFNINPMGVFGGAVAVVPTNPNQPEWQEACMVVAGPLVNFCTAPLFFWTAFRVAGTPYEPLWQFPAYLAILGVAYGIFNLCPIRTAEGQYSDGARLVQLLTGSPVLRYRRIMLRLQSTLFTQLRTRDLDASELQSSIEYCPSPFAKLHAHICAAQILEEQGRISEAGAALAQAEKIYNEFPDVLTGFLHTSFIYFRAVYDRDAITARMWWDRMQTKKIERKNVDFWLAASALYWIEGLLLEAEEAWRRAEAEARKLPQFGAYEFDRDRVAYLRTLLNQHLGPEPAAQPEHSAALVPQALEPGQQPA